MYKYVRIWIGIFILIFTSLLFVMRYASSSAPISGATRLSVRYGDPSVGASPELAAYLVLLEHPEQAWSGRKDPDQGDAFAPDPKLDRAQAVRRSELEKLLSAYAPRIWWHPLDPYPPMDPMDFIHHSALMYRSRWGRVKTLIPRGEIKAHDLGLAGHLLYGEGNPGLRPYQTGLVFNGGGYFLRYVGSRTVRKPAEISSEDVPIFWRLGSGPVSRALNERDEKSENPNSRDVLIEYWYHVPYNYATRVGIGNHQGDWEGVSMLVRLSLRSGHLRHRLLATYFSEHEWGTWRCASKVSLTPNTHHPEAFSAMGTHATYAHPGNHKTPFITDLAARGRAWDTWKRVRPLQLEPYYGYSGAWGEPRTFSFMTGPLVPGPGYKSLPRGHSTNVIRTLAYLNGTCHI